MQRTEYDIIIAALPPRATQACTTKAVPTVGQYYLIEAPNRNCDGKLAILTNLGLQATCKLFDLDFHNKMTETAEIVKVKVSSLIHTSCERMHSISKPSDSARNDAAPMYYMGTTQDMALSWHWVRATHPSHCASTHVPKLGSNLHPQHHLKAQQAGRVC